MWLGNTSAGKMSAEYAPLSIYIAFSSLCSTAAESDSVAQEVTLHTHLQHSITADEEHLICVKIHTVYSVNYHLRYREIGVFYTYFLV